MNPDILIGSGFGLSTVSIIIVVWKCLSTHKSSCVSSPDGIVISASGIAPTIVESSLPVELVLSDREKHIIKVSRCDVV